MGAAPFWRIKVHALQPPPLCSRALPRSQRGGRVSQLLWFISHTDGAWCEVSVQTVSGARLCLRDLKNGSLKSQELPVRPRCSLLSSPLDSHTSQIRPFLTVQLNAKQPVFCLERIFCDISHTVGWESEGHR